MQARHKFVITASLLCHLFLMAPLVISQAHPQTAAAQESDSGLAASGKIQLSASESEPVTSSSRQQEKNGEVFTLRGEVEITFRGYVLHADTITYNRETGDVTAEGHITFDGGPHDMHLTADRGTYNIHSQTGKFFNVAGTTGARFKGKNVTLTSSNPLAFSGKEVDKTGESRYVIHNGSVTSCELPHPKWTFSAAKIVVDVGNSARIYNTVFRVKGVPVVYLPFAAPPVEKLGRQSGFLVPTFGTSSRKGTIFGDSFYWAINRSMDDTIGAEYFSSRGWALHNNFRMRPSQRSYLNLDYFGVMDRGIPGTGQEQGGEDIKLNGEANFAHGLRGVASLNYLSSFVFRLAFTESFTQAVNSEVKSVAFLSKTIEGFSLNGFASRYQNFQSIANGDLVTIFHAPGLEVSSVDQRFRHTPFYWSFDTSLEGLRRSEPGFDTPNLVGRYDIEPRVSMPVFYKGWTFRPEVALRNTFYTEQLVPNSSVGLAVQEVVNRRAVETSVELRPPTLGKIFERTIKGRKVKHTIEPRLVYRYTNGVGNFPSIVRFDFRDILSDTNEVEYGLTQRLFLKRANQDCDTETKADSGTQKQAQASPPSG